MKRTWMMAAVCAAMLAAAADGGAAEKITGGSFDSPAPASGSYTNLTNGPAGWNREAVSTNDFGGDGGSWDVVAANHPLAPEGTTSPFLDVVGRFGATRMRHTLSSMVVGSNYVVTFRAAQPKGMTGARVGLGVRSSINLGTPNTEENKDWVVRPFPLHGAPFQAVQTEWCCAGAATITMGGTYPTNVTYTVTAPPPPPPAYATDKWQTNTWSFVATTTTMVFEIYADASPYDHVSVLLDDISVTGP